MARVIAVVGAGGKSTLIENLANKYAAENKRVCITTTTHIFKNHDRENICYRGNDEGEKLSYPGDEEFYRLCDEFEVVLVEADGSRHFPVKIPAKHEPVIPSNVNEIFVVMGLNAIDRPISEVCQRFHTADKSKLLAQFPNINDNTLVTRSIIDFIAEAYYVKPLDQEFPGVPVTYISNDFIAGKILTGKRVALILMASGSSKRFGDDNKLLHIVNGRELFRYGLDALIKAKKILNDYGITAKVFMTDGNISECEGVEIINNPDRLEGIAGSIRHGTEAAIKNNCNAVLFLAGDQPNFPAEDIARLVREFLCSGKSYGCAYSTYPANPGIFDSLVYGELLKLSGDTGALRIIKQNPQRTHYYVVSPEKLLDIDTLTDIANF